MTRLRQQKNRLAIAVALWAILLVLLALEPDGAVGLILPSDSLKNLAHTPAYGVLAFLICLFLRFKRSVFTLKMTDRNVAVFSFFLTTGWGAGTELLQKWTFDRMASWGDWGFDALGAGAGIIFFFIFSNLPNHQLCPSKTL